MGERTTAHITFREEYYAIYQDEIENNCYYNEMACGDGLVTFCDNNADYGNMGDFQDLLGTHKIPYDHRWEGGNDYAAGHQLVRWDEDGVIQATEFSDDTEGTVFIDTVLSQIDSGLTMAELRQFLLKEKETFLPWNNQVDLTQIPLRMLTPEEAALVMKYKLEKAK